MIIISCQGQLFFTMQVGEDSFETRLDPEHLLAAFLNSLPAPLLRLIEPNAPKNADTWLKTIIGESGGHDAEQLTRAGEDLMQGIRERQLRIG